MPSSLPGRQPMTTASIVRTRLIFTIPVRSPGRYGASSCLATTPSAPCEPLLRAVGVEGDRREVDRLVHQLLEPRAALVLGQLEQHLVAVGEQVEGDEARRGLLGQHVDARLGGVDALAERVEVLPALLVEQHDLAVEHVAAGGELQLGEVAGERACRCATAGRRRRRRRRRSRGSRPTWARRPSRRRSAAPWRSGRAGAGPAGRAAASCPQQSKEPLTLGGRGSEERCWGEARSRRAGGAR